MWGKLGWSREPSCTSGCAHAQNLARASCNEGSFLCRGMVGGLGCQGCVLRSCRGHCRKYRLIEKRFHAHTSRGVLHMSAPTPYSRIIAVERL
eukprot:3231646-Amphidinium_carterae.1